MLYLTFVRPLVVVWQTYFGDRQAAVRVRTHLFFSLHRPVTSFELSRSLSGDTLRILKVKISISLWRHVVTWFLNHNPASFSDYLALSNRTVLATQMGHSEAVHALYASDSRLPAKIDLHIFFQTMRTSGLWHELVGLKSNLLQDMNNSRSSTVTDRHQPHRLAIGHAPNGTELLSSTSITHITEAVKKVLVPEIVQAISQTRANDLASLLDAIGVNVQTPVSPSALDLSLTYITHPSRLQDLQKFLGDNDATFKHPQQALATKLIASKNPSILLIGPTGALLERLCFPKAEHAIQDLERRFLCFSVSLYMMGVDLPY